MSRQLKPVNLPTLSARKLNERIEKLSAQSSTYNRALINAGFGEYRFSEIRQLAESTGHVIASEYIRINDLLSDANYELKARREYHGTERPIRH